MASILNHQIIGSIDNINQKISSHARIILGISVELDRLRNENEELKKILKGHKIAIKKIRDTEPVDLKYQYRNYQDTKDIGNTDIQKELTNEIEQLNKETSGGITISLNE